MGSLRRLAFLPFQPFPPLNFFFGDGPKVLRGPSPQKSHLLPVLAFQVRAELEVSDLSIAHGAALRWAHSWPNALLHVNYPSQY